MPYATRTSYFSCSGFKLIQCKRFKHLDGDNDMDTLRFFSFLPLCFQNSEIKEFVSSVCLITFKWLVCVRLLYLHIFSLWLAWVRLPANVCISVWCFVCLSMCVACVQETLTNVYIWNTMILMSLLRMRVCLRYYIYIVYLCIFFFISNLGYSRTDILFKYLCVCIVSCACVSCVYMIHFAYDVFCKNEGKSQRWWFRRSMSSTKWKERK